MIFTPEHCAKILNKEKTQTRRLVNNGDYLESFSVYNHRRRLRWRLYRTYAIQPGRGKKSVGRFKLLGIRKERLQDISQVGAYHEGIPLTVDSGGVTPWGDWIEIPNQNWREDFAALWNSINKSPGTRWEDNPEVWVLEFELVEEG